MQGVKHKEAASAFEQDQEGETKSQPTSQLTQSDTDAKFVTTTSSFVGETKTSQPQRNQKKQHHHQEYPKKTFNSYLLKLEGGKNKQSKEISQKNSDIVIV